MPGLLHRVPLLWRLVFACACLTGHAGAAELPASPTPHYVLDEAKWLGSSAFASLDQKLQAYERETSSQIVVAIFQRIPQDEELFDYCQRIYQSWKPGLRDKDNGAILFVFANDRRVRIHTGYGLEGVLPDARCKQIIENEITPRLRQGDREGAIMAGVDAMLAATRGEYTGSGTTQLDGSATDDSSLIGLLPLVIILILIVLKMMGGGNVFYGPGGASTTRGGWTGGSSWSGGGGSSGGGFSGGGGSSGGGGASGSW